MMVLATFLVASPILIFSTLLWWGGNRLGFGPPGVPGWLTWMLVSALSFGCFYLFAAIDYLVISPATYQRDYVGAAYGTPLTLTHYEMWGFHDPGQVWHYRLPPDTLAALRKRCLPKVLESDNRCYLFSKQDERWYASVEIKGNELILMEGL